MDRKIALQPDCILSKLIMGVRHLGIGGDRAYCGFPKSEHPSAHLAWAFAACCWKIWAAFCAALTGGRYGTWQLLVAGLEGLLVTGVICIYKDT